MISRSILFFAMIFSGAMSADDYVNGYYKKNGTYVEGHHRTSPNNTKSDNYSTKGNQNPYTGAYGSKRNDYEYSAPATNSNKARTNNSNYNPYGGYGSRK